jgi:hypothetical protein
MHDDATEPLLGAFVRCEPCFITAELDAEAQFAAEGLDAAA